MCIRRVRVELEREQKLQCAPPRVVARDGEARVGEHLTLRAVNCLIEGMLAALRRQRRQWHVRRARRDVESSARRKGRRPKARVVVERERAHRRAIQEVEWVVEERGALGHSHKSFCRVPRRRGVAQHLSGTEGVHLPRALRQRRLPGAAVQHGIDGVLTRASEERRAEARPCWHAVLVERLEHQALRHQAHEVKVEILGQNVGALAPCDAPLLCLGHALKLVQQAGVDVRKCEKARGIRAPALQQKAGGVQLAPHAALAHELISSNRGLAPSRLWANLREEHRQHPFGDGGAPAQ